MALLISVGWRSGFCPSLLILCFCKQLCILNHIFKKGWLSSNFDKFHVCFLMTKNVYLNSIKRCFISYNFLLFFLIRKEWKRLKSCGNLCKKCRDQVRCWGFSIWCYEPDKEEFRFYKIAIIKEIFGEFCWNFLNFQLTVKQSEVEKELCENTFNLGDSSRMLGAPEVLQFGKNFIHLIGAKRCLDVGTFTGASALAWALALPEGGEVLSFDVDHSALKKAGLPAIKKHPEIEKKITFHLGPAVDKLEDLIAKGESGKWDFAFIDADKENYPKYYQLCMKLLRSGGIIFIDNVSPRFQNPFNFRTSFLTKLLLGTLERFSCNQKTRRNEWIYQSHFRNQQIDFCRCTFE